MCNISHVYLPTSNNLVCSFKVLGEEEKQLVCNHNYSRVCISVIVISCVYIPAATISVCSLRVLGEEEPQSLMSVTNYGVLQNSDI